MDSPVFSQDAIRSLDVLAIEQFAIPGIVLMENAGRGVAEIARTMLAPGERVVIVCGTGNNGGDGLVAARHLSNAGIVVRIVLAGDPDRVSGDAGVNLGIIRRMELPLVSLDSESDVREHGGCLAEADLLIDGLFGTGLDRPVEGFRRDLIERINDAGHAGARVLAIDLPSGLDADSGQPQGVCVRASRTATLVGLKRGFRAAREYTGAIEVVDIGVPQVLVRRLGNESG